MAVGMAVMAGGTGVGGLRFVLFIVGPLPSPLPQAPSPLPEWVGLDLGRSRLDLLGQMWAWAWAWAWACEGHREAEQFTSPR